MTDNTNDNQNKATAPTTNANDKEWLKEAKAADKSAREQTGVTGNEHTPTG